MNGNFIKRDSCPGCASQDSTTLSKISYSDPQVIQYLQKFYALKSITPNTLTDVDFTLEKCNDCSLIFQENIPGNSMMKTVYDDWLGSETTLNNIENNHNIEYYLGYFNQIYKIVDYLNKKPNELQFFDFGFGWCNYLKVVQSFGIKSSGSELSEKRIEYAKSIGITNITYDKIPNEKFDYINSDQVFEHIPNPLEILKHLKNALKPGGIIRICVPNGENGESISKGINWNANKWDNDSFNIVAPLEHINCFNYKALVKMADIAGLKEFKLFRYPKIVSIKESTTKEDINTATILIKKVVFNILKKILGRKKEKELYYGNSCNLYFQLK